MNSVEKSLINGNLSGGSRRFQCAFICVFQTKQPHARPNKSNVYVSNGWQYTISHIPYHLNIF